MSFLLAIAAVLLPAAFLLYLEWRSHPRDRRSAALRSANEPPLEGEKK